MVVGWYHSINVKYPRCQDGQEAIHAIPDQPHEEPKEAITLTKLSADRRMRGLKSTTQSSYHSLVSSQPPAIAPGQKPHRH